MAVFDARDARTGVGTDDSLHLLTLRG